MVGINSRHLLHKENGILNINQIFILNNIRFICRKKLPQYILIKHKRNTKTVSDFKNETSKTFITFLKSYILLTLEIIQRNST